MISTLWGKYFNESKQAKNKGEWKGVPISCREGYEETRRNNFWEKGGKQHPQGKEQGREGRGEREDEISSGFEGDSGTRLFASQKQKLRWIYSKLGNISNETRSREDPWERETRLWCALEAPDTISDRISHLSLFEHLIKFHHVTSAVWQQMIRNIKQKFLLGIPAPRRASNPSQEVAGRHTLSHYELKNHQDSEPYFILRGNIQHSNKVQISTFAWKLWLIMHELKRKRKNNYTFVKVRIYCSGRWKKHGLLCYFLSM